MTLEQQILERFGPLLTLAQLAELLHRSPQGLSFTLSRPGSFAEKINIARIKLGRRVYFRASDIAAALS
ncbi:DNA-binding protein [Pseudomonas akapageensis]|uniref:DNA-binding protein n=1 Tax=Pseudomonas akapageensis TaxID=2609961 RepID=UPI00140D35AE|nr:DNA-binding protein [Pseudomonas akapageensis]